MCPDLEQRVKDIEARLDAIAPKPHEYWFNVYDDGSKGGELETLDLAVNQLRKGRVATYHCKEVVYV